MDEKTEELRDIFLDVSEEETVTESQEAARGSVADSGEPDEERLKNTIAEMREKFAFETDRSVSDLRELIEYFYDGDDDETIADALSTSRDAVFEARMDLHLVRDDDPVGVAVEEGTWEHLRGRAGENAEALAEDLPLEASEVERCLAVVEANARSRRVSNRFRTTFEECLTDADLSGQLAAETQRDGLEEATEDAEVDVDF